MKKDKKPDWREQFENAEVPKKTRVIYLRKRNRDLTRRIRKLHKAEMDMKGTPDTTEIVRKRLKLEEERSELEAERQRIGK
jgi:hypothetical protein